MTRSSTGSDPDLQPQPLAVCEGTSSAKTTAPVAPTRLQGQALPLPRARRLALRLRILGPDLKAAAKAERCVRAMAKKKWKRGRKSRCALPPLRTSSSTPPSRRSKPPSASQTSTSPSSTPHAPRQRHHHLMYATGTAARWADGNVSFAEFNQL
eukprot:CAMPEP_0179928602 /NCGR_PEP_ID=MMETSP0983-20121128/8959_1 /TAXON_ID=483367 /ORGANISM="non described non described, Strain CCMP 2436" /LENGTH=153 /DNA_ID=CAMNT_0021832425 /DNA_START=253 /DNA_END=715 /DNA_ORIENTATION=+